MDTKEIIDIIDELALLRCDTEKTCRMVDEVMKYFQHPNTDPSIISNIKNEYSRIYDFLEIADSYVFGCLSRIECVSKKLDSVVVQRRVRTSNPDAEA